MHKKSAELSSQSECPVMHKKSTDKIYNVYSQEVNPDNNMPFNANQLPAPGQKKPLSVDRVTSGIPKGRQPPEGSCPASEQFIFATGGTDGTWTYPSQQMFYNALKVP
jgi:cytochrome c heme-lyase